MSSKSVGNVAFGPSNYCHVLVIIFLLTACPLCYWQVLWIWDSWPSPQEMQSWRNSITGTGHDVNDKLLQCCVAYGQSPYYQTTCLGVRLVKSVLGLMMSWLNECETPGFLSNGYGCKVSYVIYMGARCPTSWMLIPDVLSHEYRCKKCSISTVGITRQMNVTHHLSCQIKL